MSRTAFQVKQTPTS